MAMASIKTSHLSAVHFLFQQRCVVYRLEVGALPQRQPPHARHRRVVVALRADQSAAGRRAAPALQRRALRVRGLLPAVRDCGRAAAVRAAPVIDVPRISVECGVAAGGLAVAVTVVVLMVLVRLLVVVAGGGLCCRCCCCDGTAGGGGAV